MVQDRISDAAIGAVNLIEVGTRLVDHGMSARDAFETIGLLDLEVIALDGALAAAAAGLRASTRAAGLSLADRACLALAIREDAIALTADRMWANLSLDCDIELIR